MTHCTNALAVVYLPSIPKVCARPTRRTRAKPTSKYAMQTPDNSPTKGADEHENPRASKKRGGYARRRRDLNPRGAMHPYLLSREAHSTGLCDVSSADYSRTFLLRTRTAPAAHAREPVDMAEGEGFEPPVPLLTQRFSRPSLSATQTALQTRIILQDWARGCDPRIPGPEPIRHVMRQPRRPKKFHDFLSGAGSSGWSRRPREIAGAVGGQSGTRIASVAWMAW